MPISRKEFWKVKQFGEIPKEYSILPISFLNFHRDEDSNKFLLRGINVKAIELINPYINDCEDLYSISLNFKDHFWKEINKFWKENKDNHFFISTIFSENSSIYQCNLVRVNESKIYCFVCDDHHEKNVKINQELRNFKSSFHTIFNHVPVGVVILNKEGQIEDVNNFFIELFGYSMEEIISQNIDGLIVPEKYIKDGKRLTDLALNKKVIREEGIRKTKKGDLLEILIHAAPIIQDQDQTGVFLIYQDITQLKVALKKMQETGRKLEKLHQVVHKMDAAEDETKLCHVTIEAAANILKLDTCIIVKAQGEKMVPLVSIGDLALNEFPILAKGEGIVGLTFESKETQYLGDIKQNSRALSLGKGFHSVISVPIGDFGVFQAISSEIDAYSEEDIRLVELLIGHTEGVIKRIMLTKELYYQANHDALTGLINRHHFNQILEKEVKKARRYKYGLTFLMIDIDNFKLVNDSLGHLKGDETLKKIGSLIKDSVRDSDYVVRYGGDEFLVMMTEINGFQIQANIEFIIDRIYSSCEKWFLTEKYIPKDISVSIGAAHWNSEGDLSIKEILQQADEWMYSQKRSGDL